MSEEVIAKLDDLKQGQEGLQQDVRLLRLGQGDLRETLAALKKDQAEMHKDILKAIGESNESILAALEALHGTVQDHEVRIERLERKAG